MNCIKKQGLIEFIPSVDEKQSGLVSRHTLDLLVDLERRVQRIENKFGFPEKNHFFQETMMKIRNEILESEKINKKLNEE